MIVDLTKSVELKEKCRVFVKGYMEESASKIEFTFSREAMLGFATELIWLYEDVNRNKVSITTYPLKVDPAPNQALGFYLTPRSPVFMINVNSLSDSKFMQRETENIQEIFIRTKDKGQVYVVDEPSVEDEKDGYISVEPYELSKRNILDITILNSEDSDITADFSAVGIEINRDGLKDLATMLLIWANNCDDNMEYQLFREGRIGEGYNLGIVLTEDSIPLKVKVRELGTAYSYDSRF